MGSGCVESYVLDVASMHASALAFSSLARCEYTLLASRRSASRPHVRVHGPPRATTTRPTKNGFGFQPPFNPLPSPGIRCGRPIRPSAPYGPKRARLGTRMHTGVPGGVPGVSTVRKVCVTSLDCRALARSVRCSHGASHPDNMLKIWATRAARAAQGSLDAYKTRVERLTRCRQGLHGLPDPPSAASENQHCGKVHSHRGPARVRRAFRDDPLGWPSRPEDPDT